MNREHRGFAALILGTMCTIALGFAMAAPAPSGTDTPPPVGVSGPSGATGAAASTGN